MITRASATVFLVGAGVSPAPASNNVVSPAVSSGVTTVSLTYFCNWPTTLTLSPAFKAEPSVPVAAFALKTVITALSAASAVAPNVNVILLY